MDGQPVVQESFEQKIFNFLPDAKTLLIYALVIIALANSFYSGFDKAIPHLALAVASALFFDFVLKLILMKKQVVSRGAIITGLLIGLTLAPESLWYVIPAALVGILLKHFARMNFLNVFNPALAGLFVVLLFFPTHAFEGWWGYGIPLLAIALGLLVCWKADRLYALISFAFFYLAFFAIFIFVSSGAGLDKALASSINFLPVFFALFMLSDPITSPPKHKPQVAYSAIVALVSVVLLALNFSLFLYVGLFAGNALRFELSKRLK